MATDSSIYTRAGKPWVEAEDCSLRKKYNNLYLRRQSDVARCGTIMFMSKAHRRTPTAILCRLAKLNINISAEVYELVRRREAENQPFEPGSIHGCVADAQEMKWDAAKTDTLIPEAFKDEVCDRLGNRYPYIEGKPKPVFSEPPMFVTKPADRIADPENIVINGSIGGRFHYAPQVDNPFLSEPVQECEKPPMFVGMVFNSTPNRAPNPFAAEMEAFKCRSLLNRTGIDVTAEQAAVVQEQEFRDRLFKNMAEESRKDTQAEVDILVNAATKFEQEYMCTPVPSKMEERYARCGDVGTEGFGNLVDDVHQRFLQDLAYGKQPLCAGYEAATKRKSRVELNMVVERHISDICVKSGGGDSCCYVMEFKGYRVVVGRDHIACVGDRLFNAVYPDGVRYESKHDRNVAIEEMPVGYASIPGPAGTDRGTIQSTYAQPTIYQVAGEIAEHMIRCCAPELQVCVNNAADQYKAARNMEPLKFRDLIYKILGWDGKRKVEWMMPSGFLVTINANHIYEACKKLLSFFQHNIIAIASGNASNTAPGEQTIPFNEIPETEYIVCEGRKYRLPPVTKMRGPAFVKEIGELRTHNMDIRKILTENAIKDLRQCELTEARARELGLENLGIKENGDMDMEATYILSKVIATGTDNRAKHVALVGKSKAEFKAAITDHAKAYAEACDNGTDVPKAPIVKIAQDQTKQYDKYITMLQHMAGDTVGACDAVTFLLRDPADNTMMTPRQIVIQVQS